PSADEQLEAIGQERIGIVASCERRNLGGIGIDKRRRNDSMLRRLFEDLDLQLASAVALAVRDPQPIAVRAQVSDVSQLRPLDTGIEVHDEILDGHSAERL